MSNAVEGNVKLLQLLDQARKVHPTPLDVYEQRVSFIYGQLGPKSNVTREQIVENLRLMGIVRPES